MTVRGAWVHGCLVDCFDWYDKESIYLNMRYYKPGSSINRTPDLETSVFFPLAEEQKLRDHLDSIVNYYMFVRED